MDYDDPGKTRKVTLGKSLVIPDPQFVYSVRVGTPSLIDHSENHSMQHRVTANRLSVASSVLSQNFESNLRLQGSTKL